MKDKLSKFQEVCPRQLKSTPCEACPLALERINAIKSETASERKKKDMEEPSVGCPWFVSSADHNYCFWSYSESLYNDPSSDREICDTLLIPKPTLDKEFKSAISKLEAIRDSEAIQEFKESVMDAAISEEIDYTAYMPDEFRAAIGRSSLPDEETEDAPAQKKAGRPKRHPTGLPLHRDGKKVDLWGISSKQNRDKALKEKTGAPKNETKKHKK